MIPISDEDPMFLGDSGLDLLQSLLSYDPEKRISAKDAMSHPWFLEDPCDKSMPSFTPLNEISRDELKKNRKRSIDEK